MPRIRLSNILFLIPALIIGPVLLVAVITHGIILDRIYAARRWYKQRALRGAALRRRYSRVSALRHAAQRNSR